MKRFEEFIFTVLGDPKKRLYVMLITLFAFMGAVMMLPTKVVLAKMLPGKSANTFTVYVDTPSGSSIEQTHAVTDCA